MPRRINLIQQLRKVFRFGGRPDLNPDWIFNTTHILDMRAVGLARAIANPKKVGTDIIPAVVTIGVRR
ncbi:hypothetical protein BC937DRAFT_86345 [Endogone sp. FLAS-F59071]|nr:hypothetical protein BC937DRAFT_86345 [Endogone sp. FLAS-F59071]|eukprot:RUS20104.1 hypothetical protein BC937DRAFT_86345 [Endogone sp. FLAS-F59071]